MGFETEKKDSRWRLKRMREPIAPYITAAILKVRKQFKKLNQ